METTSKEFEVRINGLGKKYGDLVAVEGLTLDIYKGEILGILGPNGAGKTTTINMLSGLSPPSSGSILYSDRNLSNKHSIAGRLGICPQENVFWPKLTCKEQLVFMAEMYNINHKTATKRSEELLEFLGLKDKSDVLARKLSGGMKRRLSILLALVHDPDILILDEPEAGLDPQSRLLVRDCIKSLARDKTIILTTHNMDEADRLSDRVAIMDYGKLLLLDSPQNLKKSIGEGDLLEFILSDQDQGDQDKLRKKLGGIECTIEIDNNELLVRSTDIIEKVTIITDTIRSCGFVIREMTMRENTLEDVFIYLTGRKLRQ